VGAGVRVVVGVAVKTVGHGRLGLATATLSGVGVTERNHW